METAVAELKPHVKYLNKADLASKMLLAYAYSKAKLVHQKRLQTVGSLLARWSEGERGYLVSFRRAPPFNIQGLFGDAILLL
jgi:hypothetical protein